MNKDFSDPLEAFAGAAIYDPLSEVTRAERRLLLIVSVVCLALTWADLLPTEIEALGIAVEPENRQALVWLLAAMEIYLLIGFAIYALADKSKWDLERTRVQLRSANSLKPIADQVSQLAKDPGNFNDIATLGPVLDRARIGATALRNAKIRAGFEFYVPPAVATIALSSIAAELLDFSSPIEPILYLYQTSPRGYQAVVALVIISRIPRIKLLPKWAKMGTSRIELVTLLFKLAGKLRNGSRLQKFSISVAIGLLNRMASAGKSKSVAEKHSSSEGSRKAGP